MNRIILALLLSILPAESRAVELLLSSQLPCFESGSTDSTGCFEDSLSGRLETGLDSLIVNGWRFGDRDTLRLGALSISGMDCQRVDFALEILDGTMGELFVSLKDKAGNVSCRDTHFVFALPKVDSALANPVNLYYRLVWKKD